MTEEGNVENENGRLDLLVGSRIKGERFKTIAREKPDDLYFKCRDNKLPPCVS